MNKEIPLSIPNLNINIVENLRECIETGWISTGGRFISEFEQKMAAYTHVDDAVSVQSGTAGLHLALRVLGVQPGDEVIVPTLTFIAAVNPIRYMGAEPIFMDCDDGLCLDPDKLLSFCEDECIFEGNRLIHRSTKKRISAIVVVHIFGNLAKIECIKEIADRFQLKILEDATEALGSYYIDGPYKGQYAGTVGDIGVYSFNANKIITTGGGGMIVSRNTNYLDEARYLSITAKDDTLYFVHNEVGYNYRMLNLQAALGVSQIEELEAFISIKKKNYEKYCDCLSSVEGLAVLPFSDTARPNYWFYSLWVDEERYGMGRDRLMKELIEQGVQCRPVWKLIHTQKPFKDCISYRIENACRYEQNVLNIPCSTNLSDTDIAYVCSTIKSLHMPK